jgi:hypothetical protein
VRNTKKTKYKAALKRLSEEHLDYKNSLSHNLAEKVGRMEQKEKNHHKSTSECWMP